MVTSAGASASGWSYFDAANTLGRSASSAPSSGSGACGAPAHQAVRASAASEHDDGHGRRARAAGTCAAVRAAPGAAQGASGEMAKRGTRFAGRPRAEIAHFVPPAGAARAAGPAAGAGAARYSARDRDLADLRLPLSRRRVMDRVAARVDGHGDRHVLDVELVDRFHAEVGERDDARPADRLRHEVGRAADGHQVAAPCLRIASIATGPRSALPIIAIRPVVLEHHVGELVHARGRGRTGRARRLRRAPDRPGRRSR